MAEEQSQLRTEDPTPRRREEARKRGQVAFSPELTASVVVLAGVIILFVLGPTIGNHLVRMVQIQFRERILTDLTFADAKVIGGEQMQKMLSILGLSFAATFLAAVGVSLAQVGFLWLPDRILPDLDRVSPTTGFSRVVSLQTLRRSLIALLKIAGLTLIAALVVRSRVGEIVQLGRGNASEMTAAAWEVCIRMMIYLAAALLAVGIVDYAFQWRRIEAALKMSRQDIKEEAKREEGDPMVKARLRALQRQRARSRTLAAVPKATVVVTNPTHFAVALRYDRGSERAPIVVAKGTGLLARQIAETARRHAVPVLERPPLARVLFFTVKEGQEIPPALFQAVAEVIAFVLRLRGTV
jgi:flagellar biosynthetic protein FlhB